VKIQEFISNDIMIILMNGKKNGMVGRKIWKRAGELGLLCIDMPEIYVVEERIRLHLVLI
jgi:acyl-CoA dehydrogenase